jgi:L-threonylcarbamoyladenylate synthase
VIVLDASAAVEILLGSEHGRLVLDRLEPHAEAHVPEHFHIEAISALRRYALRGELGELRMVKALTMLNELRVVRYPVIDLRDGIWELRTRLSAYDAAYLALARRLDISLLTTDAGLAAAARAEGRLAETGERPAEIGSVTTLDATDARRLQKRLAMGEVAIFPTDTVYGLGCNPHDALAVQRMYTLKRRPSTQPAAVMFFTLRAACDALPELGARTRTALEELLPGPLTVLLPNPRRLYPLAGGSEVIGLRVPLLPERLAALRAVDGPVLQTSANLSGDPEARRLSEVSASVLEGAGLVLDGGELPGAASTVLDLRDYERAGKWCIAREGPVARTELEHVL